MVLLFFIGIWGRTFSKQEHSPSCRHPYCKLPNSDSK